MLHVRVHALYVSAMHSTSPLYHSLTYQASSPAQARSTTQSFCTVLSCSTLTVKLQCPRLLLPCVSHTAVLISLWVQNSSIPTSTTHGLQLKSLLWEQVVLLLFSMRRKLKPRKKQVKMLSHSLPRRKKSTTNSLPILIRQQNMAILTT